MAYGTHPHQTVFGRIYTTFASPTCILWNKSIKKKKLWHKMLEVLGHLPYLFLISEHFCLMADGYTSMGSQPYLKVFASLCKRSYSLWKSIIPGKQISYLVEWSTFEKGGKNFSIEWSIFQVYCLT